MIKTRDLAEEYRMSHWAGIIKEQQESGMSKKAYCESIGIRANMFYYWQRKLREVVCQELVQNQESERKGSIVPIEWTEVSKAVEIKEIRTKAIYVEVGKYRVRVTRGADQGLLAAICQTLVSL